MTAVLRRELRLLLASPTGAALGALWALCCGALFLMDLTAFEQAEQRALAVGDPALVALLDVNDLLLASVLGNVVVLFLFLAPLLSMRLFADDPATLAWLIHAAPSLRAVALGKLAAGVVVVSGLAASTALLPALLSLVARPAPGADPGGVIDVAQAVVATATVAACAACFVAVACAVAAVVDVPLAAGLLAFVVLMTWWLAPGGAALVGPDVGAWLSWASPASHLERGLRGVVDGGDVVWFVGVFVAAALATGAGLAGRRR
jgi:ABC-2 type transport system permease protein